MTTPTVAEMLKYADLQMAAEALYGFNAKRTPNQLPSSLTTGTGHFNEALTTGILTEGNLHASRFTQTQADKFVAQWKVIDHISNTTTGFSGTLFQARVADPAQDIKVGDYVLSFRSTEFVDDAVRDSYGTNKLEIKDHGWAFGQISDMESWYKDLSKAGGPLAAGAHYSVTGYSLGGHLATAFNLLRREDGSIGNIDQVVTFNAAGVGQIGGGASLTGVINQFSELRASDTKIQSQFTDSRLAAVYQILRSRLADGHTPRAAEYALATSVRNIDPAPVDGARFSVEEKWLISSLDNIKALKNEVAYTAALRDTKDGMPAQIPDANIAQEGFDYQMAMLIASAKTVAMGSASGIVNGVSGKSPASPPLTNQYDIVGRETTTKQTALVADSQWHYGSNVDLFIEDQPLTRGGVDLALAGAFIDTGALHPLQNYTQNDFGDTHSLVLIVDSLNIQNTLQTLDPTVSSDTLNKILKAASSAKAERVLGGQGKAEGDVLETILDALVQTFTYTDPKLCDGKTKNGTGDSITVGNTWADETLRKTFYEKLAVVQKQIADKNLAGKFTIDLPEAGPMATTARTDFASLLTLLTLSPFALKTIAGNETVVETALSTTWVAEYADWQADQSLTPAQLAQGQGNYTETYLKDRAQMQGYVSKFNLTNGQRNVDPAIPTISRNYLDVEKGITLIVDRTSNTTPTSLLRPQIVFGGSGSDTFFGNDEAEHLYGGAGMDRLDGGKGDDYLEGNAGSDTLTGGDNRDTLIGGAGNDILDGGKGSDTLIGGLGDDTYAIGGGNGWDWLEDKDGIGKILYSDSQGGTDIQLSGGTAVTGTDNVWNQEANGKTFWYILTDWTENGQAFKRLSIEGPDGGVFVKAWAPGQLGIILTGAALAPERTDLQGTPGNDNPNLNALPHEKTALRDTAVNQNVYGLAGADALFISQSGSIGYGGSGNDLLIGQELCGDDGNDILYGNANNNKIDGGLDDDFLQGAEGNDQLDGGDGLDFIDGGEGSDLIKGAGGGDFILGDGGTGISLSSIPDGQGKNDYDRQADGSLTPFQNSDGQRLLPQNLIGATLVEGGGADIIDAGAGNDWVLAGDGGDDIHGGLGNDYLVGQADGDRIDGGDNDDTVYGDGVEGDLTLGGQNVYTLPPEQGDDHLDGGAGNDFLSGDGGADELYGGLGNDTLVGDSSLLDVQYHGADYLSGGEGNDKLYGYGKNDTLWGGTGDDILEGDSRTVPFAQHGEDTLYGEDGKDIIQGDGGSDILFGDADNDQLFGDADDTPVVNQGSDYLDGGSGDDYLRGYAGNDTLLGGVGKDQLEADADNDHLDGGVGDDTLFGGEGNDTLSGGGGTDYLAGGTGDDTYLFLVGESPQAADQTIEAIFEESGNDTVHFEGVNASGLKVSAVNGGSALLIEYGAGDQLAIVGGIGSAVENFVVEGKSVTTSQLIGRYSAAPMSGVNANGDQVIFGGHGIDTLVATAVNAMLSGGRGNDTISASGANSILLYGLGDGTDRVTTGGSGNVLRFGEGITVADLKLRLGSLALQVRNDVNDTIHFENFDAVNPLVQRPFDRIEFAEGNSIAYEDLLSLGFDLAGTSGNDRIDGSALIDRMDGGEGNDSLAGLAGNDFLDGGAGNDNLVGGSGSDTYVFNPRSGQDVIDNEAADNPSAIDTLIFGAGIALGDLLLNREAGDLVIKVGATDNVTLKGYFAAPDRAAKIDRIVFADTTVWDQAAIEAHIQLAGATDGDDTLSGFDSNDVIDGLAGNDTIYGAEGDDAIFGSDGFDALYGDAGDDLVNGGVGADFLDGGIGNDIYFFNRGDGSDVITQYDTTVGKRDVIAFGAGIRPQDVVLERTANGSYQAVSLVFKVRSEDNSGWANWIVLENVFFPGFDGSPIEEVRFDDGSVWNWNDIKARLIAATDGNDLVLGFDGSDLLAGGGGADILEGFAGDDSMDGGEGTDSLFGGTGNDHLSGGNGNDSLYGDLQTMPIYKENLYTGGNDVLAGGAGNDALEGGAGNDTLDGGTGNDLLKGGSGNDVYRFGRLQGGDRIIEGNGSTSGGTDEVVLAAGILPSAVKLYRSSDRINPNDMSAAADDLVLVLDGTEEELWIQDYFDSTMECRVETIRFSDGTVWNANEIASRIVDLAGAINPQSGTAGANVFEVDHPKDQIIDSYTGDNDTARASVSYVLPTNVENLELTGIFDLRATGSSQNNILRGNSGDNVFRHGGGFDTMIGRLGNDTYIFDDTERYGGDSAMVVELENEGNDTVIVSTVNGYVLPDNVEGLIYKPSSWISHNTTIMVSGNALDNTIQLVSGWSSGKIYELNGGLGADTYIASANNKEIFVLDSGADLIVGEDASGIYDSVKTNFDYTLDADIGGLILTGSSAISGTGNPLNNTLDGSSNSAANFLRGEQGDDTYVLGTGDIAIESAAQGVDTVVIGFGPFDLGSYANIENMSLAQSAGEANMLGDAGDNILIGNAFANRIQGGGGNDHLFGANGLGHGQDILEGGSGDDELRSWQVMDILDGGEGNDFLLGSGAIYRFSGGYGSDVVANSGSYSGSIVFSDIDVTQIEFAREEIDLRMIGPQGTGSVVVRNYFLSGANTISSISFADSGSLSAAQLDAYFGQGNVISEGADVVVGAMGADNLFLLGGNDVAFGGTGADSIDAGDGQDLVYGGGDADYLSGGLDDDQLYGGNGIDIVQGGAGNDFLYGDAGNDKLTGGSGTDVLLGGEGADVFRFDLGSGADIIGADEHPAGFQWLDTVQMGAGILAENVDVVRPYDESSDLELRIRGTDEILTLSGFFYDNQNRCEVDEIRFEDNTVWTRNDLLLRSMMIAGTAGTDTLTGNSSNNQIYGWAGNDTLAGLDGDDLLDGGLGADQMNGGFGNDLFIVDNVGDVVFEASNGGTDTIRSFATYNLASNVETLELRGTDAINGTGNTMANTLQGNNAANTLNGGAGADLMIGGAGNDTYVVDNTADVATEAVDEGTDLVQSAVTYTLAANVENLTLTGTSAINGTGNTLSNVLTGNAAANTLSGGIGADTMIGGAGNDTYVVDNASDVVTEAPSAGADLIQSSITYVLATNVENLTLIGTDVINGTGNALNNSLIGNSAFNTLVGGAGSDTLNGGAGTDTLIGGIGNDIYVIDNLADVVTESLNEGTDTVQSAVAYTLGSNLENLTLMGAVAINGIGNELSNSLTGNTANNVLTGGLGNDTLNGGAGTDTLIGGGGSDTYVIDTLADIVTENFNEGIDTVQTGLTFTLGANLENLTLTGSGLINGTGNELNNALTGNGAANVLAGGPSNDTLNGGAGADKLIGGVGDDTYVVDNLGDIVMESLNEGIDTVHSGVNYTLGANLENLILTGSTVIGTGNVLDNALSGNGAANVLSGGAGNDTLNGGAGGDTMTGGVGNDIYVVDNTLDAVMENFNEGADTVKSGLTYTLGAHLENLTLTGATAISGTGNALENFLTGNSAVNTLTGGAGNDTLNGGAGGDTLLGGLGDDTYIVDTSLDVVMETPNEGNDQVQSAVTHTLAANVEYLILTGGYAINGTGNAAANLLRGNAQINIMNGGAGNDIFEGGAGNDSLTDTSGTALFNGGAGADGMTGGASAEIFLGGLGNDSYITAGGNDIILFNNGDGQDVFASGGSGSDTISLGGSITYADLVFIKATSDLVLKVGITDQITFKNWYAATLSKPVANLQVIAEAMAEFSAGGSDTLRNQKVEKFNFAGLVGAFDAARATNSALTSWALTNALTDFQLAGSDTAALGGDLAYQYGKNGTLAGIGVAPTLATLADANLGTAAQLLTPQAGLQAGSLRLS